MTELDPLSAAACDAYLEVIRAERAVAAEVMALHDCDRCMRQPKIVAARQRVGEARRRREAAWDAYDAAIAAAEKERQ